MRAMILLLSAAALLPAHSQQVQAALAAGSYFPMEVGNRWVYRIDSRIGTASYQTWRVDRTEQIDDKTYFVVTITNGSGSLVGETRFRVDDRGRMFYLTGAGDQLFLDTADPAAAAQLRVVSRGPFLGGIGSFADTLTYNNAQSVFISETGTLGRGIGLLASTSRLIAGSSGGFSEGRTLVEAVIGGKLRFALSATGLQLGIDRLAFDLTAKEADNCAIPCYFTACYLAPFTDPPGTYKPCTRARVALSNWPADASRSVRLQLSAPDGAVVVEHTVTVDAAPEGTAFVQLRLYSEANQPFPPGAYRLTAATEDGAAQSTVTLQIR